MNTHLQILVESFVIFIGFLCLSFLGFCEVDSFYIAISYCFQLYWELGIYLLKLEEKIGSLGVCKF